MRLSWGEKLRFFLGCLEVCNPMARQEHRMEAHRDCMSGVCPGASANGAPVSIYGPLTPPFLQRTRA